MEVGVRLKTISEYSTLAQMLNLGNFEEWLSQSVNVNLDSVTDTLLESIKGAHPSIRNYTSLQLVFWDNKNDPGHFSIALYEVDDSDTRVYDEMGNEEVNVKKGDIYTLGSRVLVYSRKPLPEASCKVSVHYGFIEDIPTDILGVFDL